MGQRRGLGAPRLGLRFVLGLMAALLFGAGGLSLPLRAAENLSGMDVTPAAFGPGETRPSHRAALPTGPDTRLADNRARPAGSETVNLRTLDELYATLAQARGGETILLEGGRYGDLYLGNLSEFDVAFPETVTIASADPGDPAIFSTAQIRFVSNLILDGLVFDYTYSDGDVFWYYPFEVQRSTNVTIRNGVFEGDIARGLNPDEDGYAYGNGLFGKDNVGLVVENNSFSGFQRGLIMERSQQITVRGNDIHAMRMDGMNFNSVQDVRIEGNHIHDFRGRPGWQDHRDMIQFWTNGTKRPSTDITIRNNVFNSGEGTFTQSIFMRNEEVDTGRAGDEMFYRNIEISGNVILNAHLHGITIGETDGLKIVNNTVVRNPRSEGPDPNPPLWIPRINLASAARNVAILRNVTSGIHGQGRHSDWEIRDNLLVQDRNPRLAYYYLDVFGPAALEDPTRIWSFTPRPGGPLDGAGIGAPRLRMPPASPQH